MIRKRAMLAANKINEQRGWIQSNTKRGWNINEVTNACIEALKAMDSFDWNIYEAKLKTMGYGVKIKRSNDGKVVGYVIKKGNSFYKSTLLGHSRSLTPSRIMNTWAKLHQDKSVFTQAVTPKGIQTVTQTTASSKTNTTLPKQQSSTKQMALHPTTISEPVRQQPVMVHHDIDVDGKHYLVDIPEMINDVLMKEATLPDDVLWSRLADVQNTAILLFANYLDAATQMSESCGGGGSEPESGWGRKEDEDDIAWARRCARQASIMHTRPVRRMRRS